MKKNKKLLQWSIFVALLFLLSPMIVKAEEPTRNFYSQIEVQENGDIKVKELIQLSGTYNGLNRDVYFRNGTAKSFSGSKSDLEGSDIYNGSTIKDIKVGSIPRQTLSFASFKEAVDYANMVSHANVGDSGMYQQNLLSDGVSLKIFEPSSKSTIFSLEYTVTDVVVVHDDIAEIAWNVLGEGYNENIGSLQIKVILPGKDDDKRVYLHGPLNGSIERIEEGALAKYNFLGAYNAVSVRVLFDKSLVGSATKYTHMNAKEDIIAYETKLADEANATRDRIRAENNFVLAISFLWLGISIILVALVSTKSKQSKKTDFAMEYYRDFPATYGPEVLQYLLETRNDEKSLSAVLLGLISKKILKVEAVEEGKKKNYKLILQETSQENLTETEKIALNMFIKKVGDGKEVSLSKVKKYCSDSNNAPGFIASYNNFVRTAQKMGKNENFFQKTSRLQVATAMICFSGFLITVLNASFETGSYMIAGAFIIGIILGIIAITRKFYTPKGAEDYAKWMAHKHFLEDFSRFDEKELPEVSLWDKYLMYATVLGCASTLEKQMKLKIDTFQNGEVYPMNDQFFYNYLIFSSLHSSINQSVHTAVSSSRSSIAASSSSSGGGFGGGSVGGGGSFGGGGGGGRF